MEREIAQLAERPTGKPKCNTDAGSSPRCGKGFFSQSTFSADPITVSVQPPCAIACINSCAHVKNPKHRQPLPLLVYTKILHTLIGMGSAALVAALPYPCKAIRISRKGKSSTEKKCRSWPYGFQRSRLVLFLG